MKTLFLYICLICLVVSCNTSKQSTVSDTSYQSINNYSLDYYNPFFNYSYYNTFYYPFYFYPHYYPYYNTFYYPYYPYYNYSYYCNYRHTKTFLPKPINNNYSPKYKRYGYSKPYVQQKINYNRTYTTPIQQSKRMITPYYRNNNPYQNKQTIPVHNYSRPTQGKQIKSK